MKIEARNIDENRIDFIRLFNNIHFCIKTVIHEFCGDLPDS
jgi:hypothetical protein